MLIGLKEILLYAEVNGCAVGAFNTPNLEGIMAVLDAAEELNSPVILNHAELHESIMPLEIIGPIMLMMAERAAVPVCVHLDHGETYDYIRRALEMGFTSVMYDGSHLPYVENVHQTGRVVDLAGAYGAGVEAEIGIMMGSEIVENAGVQTQSAYTDPELAGRFVRETGIDALAASFGTAHGFYKDPPRLDYERITRIKGLTGIPLVMHGGSGVSPDSYREAIRRGVRKINYYSYMSGAGVKGVKTLLEQSGTGYFHELSKAAVVAMRENVRQAMQVFSMK
jgi:fructose-bisphosphate aldolase class II